MSDSKTTPAVQRVHTSPCIGDQQLHHPMDKPAAQMVMYAAITGRVPQIDPSLPAPLEVATLAVRERPWSPVVLSTYLREVVRQSSSRITRPELSAWLRRQSDNAIKRLGETQTRMANANNDRAA